ncbi:hypothetical protein KP509_12G015700 [Ceratopteris richardii]|nr:hypothetical protein KP509_12G015700 [Ceratopteris richardii]
MCIVTSQLSQPYPDQPNEGILMVYTEFSPMADSNFEGGRPGESATEVERLIKRSLRDSKALDMESLCVLAGKAVWSIRVDIHVIDNGGNLIDAASIAALAALLSFRVPECSIAGAERQDVIIHAPEVREPVPLIIHYLPIAFTFGFFGNGELLVIDPSYKEELLMRGRLTIILNVHGDICAIQKGGSVGINSCDILRCLQIASAKVEDVTSFLRKAVEDYELERTQRRVKKQYRLFDAESTALDIDFQGNYFVKDDTVANMLNALVLESSSDDSSETEDAVNISECQNLKSVKQEEMKAQKLPELEPPVQIPVQQFFSVRTDQREDVDELSMDIVLSLNAHDFEDVQESAARHVHSRCLVSESCKPMSLSQHNLQIDDAKLRADVGSLKSDGLPSSRNKPQSLVDAIKWNNVKSKKAAAIKARLSLKNPI